MAGRKDAEHGAVDHGRQVVDVTDLSPREIRARIADLQDEHVVQVEQARDDLAVSIDRLRVGVGLLRARLAAKARAALPVVAGATAAGVTAVVLVRVGSHRSGRR